MKVLLAVPISLRDEKVFQDCHRDDTFERFRLLRSSLLSKNIELTTELTPPLSEYIAAIFPFGSNTSYSSEINIPYKILILTESKYISASSYLNSFHSKFNCIFTWDSELLKKEGYEPLFYTSNLIPRFDPDRKRRSLAVAIFSNKKPRGVSFRGDLYKSRMEIIKYADNQDVDVDFDLYGMGWDEYYFGGGRFLRYLNSVRSAKVLMRLFYNPPKCYKGPIDVKSEILREYNFNICPENFCVQPGYVTEKIWDSFISGAIPVYQGPEDISDIVPPELFIALNDFNSPSEIFKFISGFSEVEIINMRKKIYNFLNDSLTGKFSNIYFAESLLDKIANPRLG